MNEAEIDAIEWIGNPSREIYGYVTKFQEWTIGGESYTDIIGLNYDRDEAILFYENKLKLVSTQNISIKKVGKKIWNDYTKLRYTK